MNPALISFLASCGFLLSIFGANADEGTGKLGVPKFSLRPKGLPVPNARPRVIEGRFAYYVGFSPVILDSKLRKALPKTYLEAIKEFGPAFHAELSGTWTWEWYFDDGKMLQCSGPHPQRETLDSKFDALLKDSRIVKLSVGTEGQKEVEQDAATKPRPAVELKSEGG